MVAVRLAIRDVLSQERPMTVRQVFYQLVGRGVVDKTETEYSRTVGRLLAEMRRSGEIPFDWLADGTRWQRLAPTFDSVTDALTATARSYRRNLWRDLNHYVEVWCEKEALAGVLVEVTGEYDVPLMVTRGYPSMSYVYSAAQAMAAQVEHDRIVTVYYLGDHDPSGRDIRRTVERDLRDLIRQRVNDGTSWFHFESLAVEDWQVEHYGLPTRPTKGSDPRAKGFHGASVELDAIPAAELRRIVRKAIDSHVPDGALDAIRLAEESEREILSRIARTMGR